MLRDTRETVHGLVPEPCAQPLDQLREAQAHARERRLPVTQLHLDRLHAAAALAQESAEFEQQWSEYDFESRAVADLRLQVATQRELLVRCECAARLGQAARGAIEHR